MQFSWLLCSPNTGKDVFNPNVTTFQSNYAEGLHFNAFIVYILKKGDREDPSNYRSITLFNVVGKVFCKNLNNRLVQCLDKGVLHEEQAGFRLNRGCMDNVYTYCPARALPPPPALFSPSAVERKNNTHPHFPNAVAFSNYVDAIKMILCKAD